MCHSNILLSASYHVVHSDVWICCVVVNLGRMNLISYVQNEYFKDLPTTSIREWGRIILFWLPFYWKWNQYVTTSTITCHIYLVIQYMGSLYPMQLRSDSLSRVLFYWRSWKRQASIEFQVLLGFILLLMHIMTQSQRRPHQAGANYNTLYH